jgi:hypothetical protein
VAAASLAIAAATALAHDFLLIRQGQNRTDALVLDHSTGQRAFTIRAGESVSLIVHDVSDPPCRATVSVNAVVGTSASIAPNGSRGAVRDQPFVITGKTPGVTTFQIGVVGEGGRCNENSVNDVVVTVVGDADAAEADAAQAGAQIVKDMKTTLATAWNKLKGDVGAIRDGVKGGTVPPPVAACQVLDTYYDVFRAAALLRLSSIGTFRSQIVTDVTNRGFTVNDEARGLLPGYRYGAWTLGVRNIRDTIRLYDERVRTSLDRDAATFEKAYSTAKIPLLFNYDCCCCDCCCDDPFPPTISTAIVQALTSPPRLELGMIGALSTLDATGKPVGYLWVIGHGDPAQGAVEIDILAGDGTTTTKTATIPTTGKFRVDFDGMKTGMLYQIEAKYLGATGSTRLPKRIIDMPFVPD